MHQRRTYDPNNRYRHPAIAVAEDNDRETPRRLSEETFTLTFYASVGIAGLLSLIGTVAYGYILLMDLL
jgi:hypothetical protein